MNPGPQFTLVPALSNASRWLQQPRQLPWHQAPNGLLWTWARGSPWHLLASVVPGNSHSSSHFLSSRLPEGPHEHRSPTHRGIGNLPWPHEAPEALGGFHDTRLWQVLKTQAPSLPCASQLPWLRSASGMPGSQSVATNPGSRRALENYGARSSTRPVTMVAGFQATSAPGQLPQPQVSGPPQCQISPMNQEFRLALLVPDPQSAPSPGNLPRSACPKVRLLLTDPTSRSAPKAPIYRPLSYHLQKKM